MESVSGFPSARLRVRQQTDGDGRLRLVVAGEIDLSSVDTLAQALAAVLGTGAAIAVDLAEVTFLDSVGIAALITARKKAAAAGQTLTVVNPWGRVRRVLDLTGVFPILSGQDGPGKDLV